MIKFRLFILVCAVTVTISRGQQCQVVPKCTCDFDGENVDVEEQSGGSEMLAGTVGALGSAVVTGGGLGAWALLRGRTGVTPGDEEIAATDDGGERKKGPPGNNVYKAGKNDPNSHKVSGKGNQTGPI
ncbi:uncharacterized protein LOC128207314 [Mya arenaria]|uniref:uncharacterized protein LOC128207314 n=1 Tax=Mya arenaria TaxID=6604 RepID=UPI0022E3A5FF|nr:uncharacterized protein LOC128207314 [Mya arenaria]